MSVSLTTPIMRISILVAYLREVIDDMETTVAPCKIQFDAPEEIQFAADRAILLALSSMNWF